MNFFNLFHITPIIKGTPHNGFEDLKRPNPTLYTNKRIIIIYILNNIIMIFEL